MSADLPSAWRIRPECKLDASSRRRTRALTSVTSEAQRTRATHFGALQRTVWRIAGEGEEWVS